MTDRTASATPEARPSVRSVLLRPAHEVAGMSAHGSPCAGNGQVFGLAGTSAEADPYWPSLPGPVSRTQCV